MTPIQASSSIIAGKSALATRSVAIAVLLDLVEPAGWSLNEQFAPKPGYSFSLTERGCVPCCSSWSFA